MAANYAVIEFSYNCLFLVPVKDLTKFLETINACSRIDTGYLRGEMVTYKLEDQRAPRVTLINGNCVIPEKMYNEKAAEEAAKAEKQRQEREAAKAEAEAAKAEAEAEA